MNTGFVSPRTFQDSPLFFSSFQACVNPVSWGLKSIKTIFNQIMTVIYMYLITLFLTSLVVLPVLSI